MSTLLLIPIIYLAAVLDAWLSSRWEVGGITPDLLALVAFAWLANARGRYAFLVAALVGLASDLSSSAPLGIGMTTFAVMGYAVIFLRQNLHLEGAVARLGIVWLGTTSICLLQGVALRLMGNLALPWATLIERAALVGLYTTGLAIPLLMMLQWFGFKKQSATVIDQPIPAS